MCHSKKSIRDLTLVHASKFKTILHCLSDYLTDCSVLFYYATGESLCSYCVVSICGFSAEDRAKLFF